MSTAFQNRSPLHALLWCAAHDREDLSIAEFSERDVRWAIETGLGPLLFRATRAHPQTPASPFWPLLRSADLTARVLTAELLEAMEEIIDACAGQISSLTLLKGISICDQYYPEPHLRPMRDIDFLVAEADLPRAEAVLRTLGYHQQSPYAAAMYATHHHSMPFYHSQRGVWVEVHRGLVSQQERHRGVFCLDMVRSQLCPSVFRGRAVTRLSAELQVPYIASHWAREFKTVGGTIALLDLIYLLKNAQDTLHWERILDWIRGSPAAAHLYLLLSYLDLHHLTDVGPAILSALSTSQPSLGPLNRKILHTVIDRYLVNGRTC
ncbi:MAG: nucleotidyltransferase family protein, partial [Candidatus Binatia bacterium]|nr:nucleotidyltransferase family protein [Candidatus Binatia bacterium]